MSAGSTLRARCWAAHGAASERILATAAWRGVEAQHRVSTMRLVDSLAEQAVLEQLLDDSKPPLPEGGANSHYLLFTPFRYCTPYPSRFRRASDPGIWYGAEQRETACAEVAYWRWRLLTDSEGLIDQELLTEHTLFRVRIEGPAVDLLAPPWDTGVWDHPEDYAPTQDLAADARARGVQWLRYASARTVGGTCCAVLALEALRGMDASSQQTWHCRTTRDAVRMIHDDDRYEWRNLERQRG